LIFLRVPLLVEPIFPERICITTCLILAFPVDTLKEVRTGFSFLYLKSWKIDLEVCLIISYHIPIMFDFVRTITFDIFGIMCMVHKGSMALFLAVFVLENAKVYVCSTDSYNVAFYIKAYINETLSLRAALNILYIDLDNYHIGLRKCFDYLRLRHENNIIKDMCRLNGFFNYISCDISRRIFGKVRNAQDLEIQLGLRYS